jgi:spore photoproduct lyase
LNLRQIFIAPDAPAFDLTRQITNAFHDATQIALAPGQQPLSHLPFRRQIIEAKRSLFLDCHKGPLIRPLARPYGKPQAEFYLYTETGCPFDCQYCFLQDWLASALPTIHVNRNDLEDQIAEQVNECGGAIYLHAGEMADAFALDPITGQSQTLHRLCQRFPDLICELRTKSDRVGQLIDTQPALANMVLSWTLAPEAAIVKYEPGTATLTKRIDAIGRASAAGFPIALRIDPVICEGDFEADYTALLRKVDAALSAPPVDVTAGSLRMTGRCLALAKSRFPKSRLFAGELVPCADGKHRYARPLRKKAYRAIESAVQQLWGAPFSLCMEPE